MTVIACSAIEPTQADTDRVLVAHDMGRSHHAHETTGGASFRPLSALAGYLPAELSAAQHLQRGNLPIPRARFRSSMLLPSMHRVLSWCFVATGRVEYQGRTVGMMSFLSESL